MSYVCEVINTTTQACEQWAELQHTLPKFTAEQLVTISTYILLACTVAYCFKLLGTLIKTFIKG